MKRKIVQEKESPSLFGLPLCRKAWSGFAASKTGRREAR